MYRETQILQDRDASPYPGAGATGKLP